MFKTNYKEAASPQEIINKVLNDALVKAMKTYDPTAPIEHAYGFRFTIDMTFEEELLEIFNALVRSGVHPWEAKKKAPRELEHIYKMQTDYQEYMKEMEDEELLNLYI